MRQTAFFIYVTFTLVLIRTAHSQASEWFIDIPTSWTPVVFVEDAYSRIRETGNILLAQAAQPVQPFAPGPTPGADQRFDTSSTSPSPFQVAALDDVKLQFQKIGEEADLNREVVKDANDAPGGSSVTADTANLMGSPSSGAILRDSAISNSVTAQRRSPVAFDPHIRGFRFGQIWTQSSGQYWSPVRQDLDSMLGKIDPSLIEDIAVIPGPYGLRYGPGFAFINAQMLRTPRYQCGFESHQNLGANFHDNRGRIFGRASAYGGSTDWGYRIHYGSRTGSDYESGNGTLIPSSYDNQTFLGQLGFDLTSQSSVEVSYNRLDQNDTEYALQFFDIGYLGTDSFNVNYIHDDPCSIFNRIRLDAWYNRTRYDGDNRNASKDPVVGRVRAAITAAYGFARSDPPNYTTPTLPQFNDIDFMGESYGNRMLTGGRAVFNMGDDNWVHGRVGADIRFEDQAIREDYLILEDANGDDIFDPGDTNELLDDFYTNLPKSWLVDAGIFSECILPMASYWKTTVGARLDFVHTDARIGDLRDDTNFIFELDQFTQDDTLYAFYMINDLDLTSHWSVQLGFGHSQRPPTLVERYSDGLFLGLIQSGFSRVVGDPNLKKERLWQIDLGFKGEYERIRGRANLYYSWVLDFATYSGNIISFPTDARLLKSINTDYATLTGFEVYGEDDLSDYLTLFGAMRYVQGTDQVIDVPLWGIAPLDGRAGVRLHDGDGGRTWGIELAARMVDRQDRAGFIRNVYDPNSLIAIEQITPGFTTVDLRTYYNYTDKLSFIFGIENLLDKNYLEHLDLRLPEQLVSEMEDNYGIDLSGLGIQNYPAVAALSPGITFYAGFELMH